MEIDETEKKLHTQEGTEPSAMNETDVSCKTSYFHKDNEIYCESQEVEADFEDFFDEEEQIREQFKRNDPNASKNWGNYKRKQVAQFVREGIRYTGRQDPRILKFIGKAPTDIIDKLLAEPAAYQMPSDKMSHQIQLAINIVYESVKGLLRYGADEQFWAYDWEQGLWVQVNERYLGIKLKDFAIRVGCYALHMSTYTGIEGLIKQAKFDLFAEMETKRGLLNFKNGTYDFENDVFREHREEDFLTYVLPYDYDPKASHPKWDKVLSEWLDDEVIQVLQEAVGYTFMDCQHEKIPMLLGGGRNGKSVCLETISNVLGSRNITNFSLAHITDKDGLDRASMEGKLLNISMDASQKIGDPAIFKSYVTGEGLKMRRLYKQPYTSANYPKTILAANALPKTEDLSDGYFRRLLIIPFERQIPEDKVDTELKSKLVEESAGILNWIIEGARRLRKQGRFSPSTIVDNYLERYKRDSNTVALYVDEIGLVAGNDDRIEASKSYEAYSEWSRGNGYAKMGTRTYYGRLSQLGFEFEKISGSKWLWFGQPETLSEEESRLPF